jgi:FixJ family two-component response regulator
MPHKNGIELAKTLLKRKPEIPIILTTGYSHYDHLVAGDEIMEIGIIALLKKPYEKDQLLGLIIQTLKTGLDEKKESYITENN